MKPPVPPDEAREAALREAHPFWYAVGTVMGAVIWPALGIALEFGLLLLALDLIGDFDLSLRNIAGIMLTAGILSWVFKAYLRAS